MKEYNHLDIEKKWQDIWEEKKVFEVGEDTTKPKWYSLIEFPYPSGDGLHVGHIRSNTAMDIISRKRRMEGFNVLYPIGWDAFGLPTENYAIKTGIQPAVVTKNNTDTFRRQLKALGFSFDWSREVNTTDPKYYRWTQWIFLKLLEQGLAYKARMFINWCPKDKIGLANEEVIAGCCERCGTAVEKREKEQWMLAITKYADRLDKDLDTVDYLEKIKIQQRNWIGKSEGAEIDFNISDGEKITVFTTRPDTIFGATYLVLAPEHALVQSLKASIQNWNEVEKYIADVKKKTDIERGDDKKEKTGVELKGVTATNPATNEQIPVWIADYVLASYGTGTIMAVPANDTRDEEFAVKFGLPIIKDYKPAGFEDFGKKITKYKLRDWVFSRQRYWGEPIPVVHCGTCGIVPLSEKDLPLTLPEVEKYEPTDTGESPLAAITDWVNTVCPKCGGKARRETDTMPNWAGSSWYFLRYCDPKNDTALADSEKLKYWMGTNGIDWYNGGMEHTTLHLLYSRFWNKFLFDIGVVPTSEPYQKRTSHGLVLAGGGEKMSKSKGNVVNPDKIVQTFGADTLRTYEMFMGPFDQAIPWGEENIIGVRRFLEKVWRLQEKVGDTNTENKKLETLLHKTIKKISENIEAMSFNTAVSAMMILTNEFEKQETISRDDFEIFLKLLSPFAPHITEEIWQNLGNKTLLALEKWPTADMSKIQETEVVMAVQISGKVRGTVVLPIVCSEAEAVDKARAVPEIEKWIADKNIQKIVYIPGKILNFVTSA